MLTFPLPLHRVAALFLLLVLLAGSLSACGHVPASTLWQLRTFDFLTFDPAALRAAVVMPGVIRPNPGTTTLDVTLKTSGAEAREVKHVFALQPFLESDLAPFKAHRRAGDEIYFFKLTEADAELVRALQREGRAAKAAGRSGNSLTIAISSKACRPAALQAGPLLTTTLIRTEPAMGYLVLLQDIDLRAAIRDAGKDFDAEVPPCG